MYLRLFHYTKRFNSTKHPDPTDSDLLISGLLKENCSIKNPTIRVHIDDNATDFSEDGSHEGAPIRYNYAFINAFQRFYWIKDAIYEPPYWVLMLEEDLLGTWKSAIGSTTQYILRAADGSPSDIIDSAYPATATVTTTINSIETPFTGYSNTSIVSPNTCVLGCITGDPYAATYGSVSYYTFSTVSGLLSFNEKLFATQFDSATDNMYEITEDILLESGLTIETLKCLFNPIQYITSLKLFPMTLNYYSLGANSSLKLGWWDTGIEAVNGVYKHSDFTDIIKIPKHPLAASRGTYLNNEPYSSYELVYEPFGSFNIPAYMLWNSDSLHIFTRVDQITGFAYFKAYLNISGQTGQAVVASATNQISITLPLGQLSQDVIGAMQSHNSASLAAIEGTAGTVSSIVSGTVGTLGNIAVGNYLGAASTVTNAITSGITSASKGAAQHANLEADAAKQSAPTVQQVGSASGSSAVFSPIKLIGRFKDVVDSDPADLGYPYYHKSQIGTHSGYIKCSDVDLSGFTQDSFGSNYNGNKFTMHASADELVEIKSLMESGIFYQ